MKRWLCLITILVLLLGGCRAVPREPSAPLFEPFASATEAFQKAWAYPCLSTDQKQNYAAVYEAVADGFEKDTYVTVRTDNTEISSRGISVALPVPLDEESDVVTLYSAIMQDNPQFFHLGSVYGYDGRQYGDSRRITALTLTYTMSVEQRVASKNEVDEKVASLLEALPQHRTDFETEYELHNSLTALCTYDAEAASAVSPLTEHAASFTVYGALSGKAVCEGYARAMQYLLNRAGGSATVVTGRDADGQPHMWNAVRIDGKVYHLDVTWNDSEMLPTYTYFNLNEEEILRTHQIDDTVLGLPTAIDTAANYYRMTNAYLDTTRIEEIASHIAGRLAEGDGEVHVQFSDSSFGTALFFVRSEAWFTDTVNAYSPNEVPLLEQYAFTYNEIYKTLTICKKTS